MLFRLQKNLFQVAIVASLLFSNLQHSYATEPACLLNAAEQVGQPLGDTSHSRRVKSATSPLAEFYSQDMWEGTIASRVEKLLREEPELKIHKNVRFRYKGDDGVEVFKTKTVLEIPANVSSEVRSKINSALSRGVVSFPVREGGGHLYTRMGNMKFSQYGGFEGSSSALEYVKNQTNYYSVIEPVIAMRAGEEMRLRHYVKNVIDNATKVLGRHNYDGSGSGDSNRTLVDNAPVNSARGHNCTSWICTSPVGEIDNQGKREAFITMTKAPLSDEVHTNPGWLNFHLTGRVTEDRNPIILFWAKEGDSVEARIGGGEDYSFRWNFSLH